VRFSESGEGARGPEGGAKGSTGLLTLGVPGVERGVPGPRGVAALAAARPAGHHGIQQRPDDQGLLPAQHVEALSPPGRLPLADQPRRDKGRPVALLQRCGRGE
jgi:hypothetical protein